MLRLRDRRRSGNVLGSPNAYRSLGQVRLSRGDRPTGRMRAVNNVNFTEPALSGSLE